jgi:aminoglycoside 3-N-acetyltransferase
MDSDGIRECGYSIRSDLERLGVARGGALLVHSSFKSLGHVPGGIQTLIGALADALGPEGTLLMPSLSYATVTRANPRFDVRHTPSCVGAVPEYFRKLPGTLRSVHPTHSMCGRGRLAGELFRDHMLDDTPCGPHSPYARLRHAGGQILMLGCGLLHNTTMHAVEEAAGAPYLFEPEPIVYRITDRDGVEHAATHRRHADFPQHYDRAANGLSGRGLAEGQVQDAQCWLYDAGKLWGHAMDMLGDDILSFYKD